MLSPVASIPHFGLALGYERVLGRRFTVGGRFEYGFQQRGYWHLQGLSEAVTAALWLPRGLRGFFFEASFAIAHQVLTAAPRHSRLAVVPGLSLGFRWEFSNHLLLGLQGGLRWGAVVRDGFVCVGGAPCPSVREGAYARLTVDLGYAF